MTKETDFKARLVAVIADLQQQGTRDAEAMWLLGSLAHDLAANFNASSWRGAKSRMTRETYDMLLTKFREEGNAHHRKGRARHAYAIQALAMSLIAPTQDDPEIRDGGKLLDTLIDSAVVFYRRSTPDDKKRSAEALRSS